MKGDKKMERERYREKLEELIVLPSQCPNIYQI